MIVPGWAFPGGFPTESMAQTIGEEGNTGRGRPERCEGAPSQGPVTFRYLLIFDDSSIKPASYQFISAAGCNIGVNEY